MLLLKTFRMTPSFMVYKANPLGLMNSGVSNDIEFEEHEEGEE